MTPFYKLELRFLVVQMIAGQKRDDGNAVSSIGYLTLFSILHLRLCQLRYLLFTKLFKRLRRSLALF